MSINQSFDNNFVSNYIRELRNSMLLESDKFMIPDFPITDEKREEWKVYRQLLRDLPENTDLNGLQMNCEFQLINFTWPTQPS